MIAHAVEQSSRALANFRGHLALPLVPEELTQYNEEENVNTG